MYSAKFSRRIIFAVFADRPPSAKNISHEYNYTDTKIWIRSRAMALYRYLKRQSKDKPPDPRGPLSRKLPPASIASANKEVRRVILDREPVKGVKARILSRPQSTALLLYATVTCARSKSLAAPT